MRAARAGGLMGAPRMSADELPAPGITVDEVRDCDGIEHRTTYTTSKEAFIRVGIAAADQCPPDGGPTKSGSHKGSSANPSQRWKVCRRSRSFFDVHRLRALREPRPGNIEDSGFQRLMANILRGRA